MYRAHLAVNAVQHYAAERGWINHPFTPSEASPDYIEALVQLADDAGWLAREIPLPEHPDPQHPTIYYTQAPVTGLPVPRADSLIRANYLRCNHSSTRVTRADYIYPYLLPRIPVPDYMAARGLNICYSLQRDGRTVRVLIHRIAYVSLLRLYIFIPLDWFRFSPVP